MLLSAQDDVACRARCFLKVNFAAKEHDLGFALMNQLRPVQAILGTAKGAR